MRRVVTVAMVALAAGTGLAAPGAARAAAPADDGVGVTVFRAGAENDVFSLASDGSIRESFDQVATGWHGNRKKNRRRPGHEPETRPIWPGRGGVALAICTWYVWGGGRLPPYPSI